MGRGGAQNNDRETIVPSLSAFAATDDLASAQEIVRAAARYAFATPAPCAALAQCLSLLPPAPLHCLLAASWLPRAVARYMARLLFSAVHQHTHG